MSVGLEDEPRPSPVEQVRGSCEQSLRLRIRAQPDQGRLEGGPAHVRVEGLRGVVPEMSPAGAPRRPLAARSSPPSVVPRAPGPGRPRGRGPAGCCTRPRAARARPRPRGDVQHRTGGRDVDGGEEGRQLAHRVPLRRQAEGGAPAPAGRTSGAGRRSEPGASGNSTITVRRTMTSAAGPARCRRRRLPSTGIPPPPVPHSAPHSRPGPSGGDPSRPGPAPGAALRS